MADTYTAPVRDMLFVLETVCDLEGLSRLEGYEHADPETVRGLLEEAGRFFSDVIAPLNRVGDQQRSRLVEGNVVTPDGFKEAYRRFTDAGWPGAHMPAEWGGGGLPMAVGIAIQEMVTSASMAFSLCPLLTQAGIEALVVHGTPEQQETYLTKLVTGEWAGTMQPHRASGRLRRRCAHHQGGPPGGRDLPALRHQDLHHLGRPRHDRQHRPSRPRPHARCRSGDKGDLAVPRSQVPGECRRSLGERNDVEVVSLEHKMGIHASPTCVMSFGDEGEGAVGYLIGEEQQGMRLMFTMMNNARLGVGTEGVAIAERAYQQALSFSQERRQGRATGATESSLIIEHPDVRRMLLTQKALIEAMRALLYHEASLLDLAERHPDADVAGAQRRTGRPLHPDGESVVHRSRGGAHLAGAPGPWRHGVCGGDRGGPAHARQPDRPHLRGNQRHPGHRPGGPQAPDEGGRGHRRPARRHRDDGLRLSAKQGWQARPRRSIPPSPR